MRVSVLGREGGGGGSLIPFLPFTGVFMIIVVIVVNQLDVIVMSSSSTSSCFLSLLSDHSRHPLSSDCLFRSHKSPEIISTDIVDSLIRS